MADAPDITRDRMILVGGAVTFSVADVMCYPSDPAPAWVTLVPVVPTEHDAPDSKLWPHERQVLINHDTMIGTVAELVAFFQEKLTHCWEALACKQPDGTYGVIPTLGEVGFRKQTEMLQRHGLDTRPPGFLRLHDNTVLELRQAKRNALAGVTVRQSAYDRDVLVRLVGAYASRRRPGEASGQEWLTGIPGDQPERIQKLIDALTVLKEDAEAWRRGGADACLVIGGES